MAIRKASKAPFPYGAPGVDKVGYFYITDECIPEPIRDAVTLTHHLREGTTVYAAWPGKTRTDLFVIDEPSLLLDSLR